MPAGIRAKLLKKRASELRRLVPTPARQVPAHDLECVR
jgi:hypothetical protein